MEEKIAKDIATQLKRIADALDKQNMIEEKKLKSEEKVNKLQEKKLRSDLREGMNINEDTIIKVRPNFKGQ